VFSGPILSKWCVQYYFVYLSLYGHFVQRYNNNFLTGCLVDVLVPRECPHPAARNFVTKETRVLVVAQSENFVILACTVFIGLQRVTDGQTNGRTPQRQLRRDTRTKMPATGRHDSEASPSGESKCTYGQTNWVLYHRLNGSSSHVLTATSLSYGKAKNSTPQNKNPWFDWDKIWHGWLCRLDDPLCKISCKSAQGGLLGK